MNPLNPWVALTEMLILLAIAFGLGYGVGYWPFREPLLSLDDRIRQAKLELEKLQKETIF